MIKVNCGQPSYNMENDSINVYTTVLGGHTTAVFKVDKQTIAPYFVAPWWKEGWDEEAPPLRNILRGNFFCMPIGGDSTGYNGKVTPGHGYCANCGWDYIETERIGSKQKMKLCFYEDEANITKTLEIINGQNVLYEKNTLQGYQGKYPIGFHPTLKLPDKQAKAHLTIGNIIKGTTAPIPPEKPENKGYYLLKTNQEITDITKIHTIYGDSVDLTSMPIKKGFEELVQFALNTEKLGYTAITYIDEGYVYFQLKNTKKLPNTMLWISNGGRHYAPWNGRCTSVLGIEECVSYFTYGAEKSAEENVLSKKGYKTYINLKKDQSYSFELISGIVKVPEGFEQVEDIVPNIDGICIIGSKGERINQKIDLSFLE